MKLTLKALLAGLRMAAIVWAALRLQHGGSIAVSSALLAAAPLSALLLDSTRWISRIASVVEAYGYALWFVVLLAGDRFGLRSCEAKMVMSTVAVGLFATSRQIRNRSESAVSEDGPEHRRL